MGLLFVNAKRNAARVTAHVDSFATAIFTLQYFDSPTSVKLLGTSPLQSTFSWDIPADLLVAPPNDFLDLLLTFRPAVQQGGTNLWLSADQGDPTGLLALNHPDAGNIQPPYRACSAMNATNTRYVFSIRVA